MQMIDETCVFAGSFDPVTNGHAYLIGMAAMTFKKVIVAIGVNEKKKYFYSLEKRLEMLKKTCAKYDSVTVTSYNGLTADFMKSCSARYLVRGVRNQADLKYEEEVFKAVLKDYPEVEVMMFNCPKELSKVSSTLVKQLIADGKPYSKYVPYEIADMLKNK